VALGVASKDFLKSGVEMVFISNPPTTFAAAHTPSNEIAQFSKGSMGLVAPQAMDGPSS